MHPDDFMHYPYSYTPYTCTEQIHKLMTALITYDKHRTKSIILSEHRERERERERERGRERERLTNNHLLCTCKFPSP